MILPPPPTPHTCRDYTIHSIIPGPHTRELVFLFSSALQHYTSTAYGPTLLIITSS